MVSRSIRSVDYLKLLDVNRLQKAEADALIRWAAACTVTFPQV